MRSEQGKRNRTLVQRQDTINLNDWYTASQAAERLTRNSGKTIHVSYPRKLAEYGRIRAIKLGANANLYHKEDINAYIVEERGEKSARAKRQNARPKLAQPAPKPQKKSRSRQEMLA